MSFKNLFFRKISRVSYINESYHWIIERAISLSSLSLLSAVFLISDPPKLLDYSIGVILPIHSHIGFQSIITDYIPLRKFPLTNKVSNLILNVSTVLVLYGLWNFNMNQGIIKSINQLWNGQTSDLEKKT